MTGDFFLIKIIFLHHLGAYRIDHKNQIHPDMVSGKKLLKYRNEEFLLVLAIIPVMSWQDPLKSSASHIQIAHSALTLEY